MWLLQLALQWHATATYSTVDAAAATPQQEITAVLDESKLRRESHGLQQVSSLYHMYLSAVYSSSGVQPTCWLTPRCTLIKA